MDLHGREMCLLVLKAICQEKSVDLICNTRVENQLDSIVSRYRHEFRFTASGWPLKVSVSDFVNKEQFEEIRREHEKSVAQSNSVDASSVTEVKMETEEVPFEDSNDDETIKDGESLSGGKTDSNDNITSKDGESSCGCKTDSNDKETIKDGESLPRGKTESNDNITSKDGESSSRCNTDSNDNKAINDGESSSGCNTDSNDNITSKDGESLSEGKTGSNDNETSKDGESSSEGKTDSNENETIKNGEGSSGCKTDSDDNLTSKDGENSSGYKTESMDNKTIKEGESWIGLKRSATIDFNMSATTVLDVVRENLHLSSTDIAVHVFQAICQEKSIEFIFTDKMEHQIVKYTTAIKRNLINDDGKMTFTPFRVMVSDFVQEEQFDLMCEESAVHKKSNPHFNLWHGPFARWYSLAGNKQKESEMKLRSKGADREPKQTVSYMYSETETYLYINWSPLRSIMKRNGWQLAQPVYETLIMKVICEEQSVDLIRTPRLKDQIIRFTSMLRSKYKKLGPSYRKHFWAHITQGPPWACKILASEFHSREQFQRICHESVQHGPHPKWTEFVNRQDFEVPLAALSHEDMSEIVVKTEGIDQDELRDITQTPLLTDSSASHEADPDEEEYDVTITNLNVKRSTMQNIMKQNPQLPDRSKELNKLVFKAICQEKSVDLKYTKRLEHQISWFMHLIKSEMELDKVVDWPCKVVLSEFVNQEQFYHLRRKNARDRLQERSDMKEGKDSKDQLKEGSGMTEDRDTKDQLQEGTDMKDDKDTKDQLQERSDMKEDNDSEVPGGNTKDSAIDCKTATLCKNARVPINFNHKTVLDIVKENLDSPPSVVDQLVFSALCKEESVDLIYSDRLKGLIHKLIFKLSSQLRNVAGITNLYWPCRVHASEFHIQSQFVQMCIDNEQYTTRKKNTDSEPVYKKCKVSSRYCKVTPPNKKCRSGHNVDLHFEDSDSTDSKGDDDLCDFFGAETTTDSVQEDKEGNKTKKGKKHVKSAKKKETISGADSKPKQTVSYHAGVGPSTFLYINWSSVIAIIKRNGWQLSPRQYELLILKVIHEEKSVDLILTPRLKYQILTFSTKLRSNYQKCPRVAKNQFCRQLKRSRPWACQVFASEFTSQEQYLKICEENKQHRPHPKWTEFENPSDFKVPLKGVPLKDVGVTARDRKSSGLSSYETMKSEKRKKKMKHKKKKWIQCDECEWKFRKPVQLLLHSKWHLHVCCYCGLSYNNKYSRISHMKNKHQYISNQCMCQGKWVKYRHRKMEEHVCSWCNKRYSTKAEAKTHYPCVLRLSANKRMCCMCYKGFPSVPSLIRHTKYFHSKSWKFMSSLQCKYCERYMADVQQLRRHIHRHEKKYKRFWMARVAKRSGWIRLQRSQEQLKRTSLFRYNMMPNSMMPNSSNMLAKSSNMLANSSNMLAKSSNMLAKSSNVLPNVSSRLPNSSNMLPHASNMLRHFGNMLPNSSNLFANSSSILPNAISMMPNTSNMLPHSSSMPGDFGNMLPNSRNMFANAINMLPNSHSMLPNPANTLPNSTNMQPHASNMLLPNSSNMFLTSGNRPMLPISSNMLLNSNNTVPNFQQHAANFQQYCDQLK
ncbi:uncharacterized protein [Amphiura filiformis]|uniref:uncharacterized protein n=1 Tax=Amphiura filiformis TaxID=82378 RepID=UPI003B20B900